MTLVVDASVACKWFIAETDQSLAFALIASGERLIAPEVVLPELCIIFWRKVRLNLMTPAQAEDAAARAASTFSAVASCAPLTRRAMHISATLDHPAYDCFYLALAEVQSSQVVTADRRLVAAVQRSPWAQFLRPLKP